MKQSSLTIFFAALMTALFSACSDDFGSKDIPQEELYTRAFIKEFGVFDMAHTWNLATEGTITVTPISYINECKVYARYEGEYYYVARAINAYKEFTLTFDIPSGVTDLKLVIDGMTYYAQVGTRLQAGGRGSRTMHSDADNTDAVTIISLTEWEPFSEEYALSYQNTVSENWDNRFKEEITQDFLFTSNLDDKGLPVETTIYPVYWQTSQTHTIGVYYYPDNDETQEMVKVPIYTSKSGTNSTDESIGDIQYSSLSGTSTVNVQSTDEDILEALGVSSISFTTPDVTEASSDKTKLTLNDVQLQTILNYVKDNNTGTVNGTTYSIEKVYFTSVKHTNDCDILTITCRFGTWSDWAYVGTQQCSYPNNGVKFRSKGIKFTVDAGIRFGMYTDFSETNNNSSPITTHYSQAYLNSDPYYSYHGYNKNITATKISSKGASYAATFYGEETKWLYLCFEDWSDYYGDSDMDLNDMVVRITPTTLTTKTTTEIKAEEQSFTWLIAAEDLGTTDDFDFNDMVVAVSSLPTTDVGNNNTTFSIVKFTALAAGGTLPLYLHLVGEEKYVRPEASTTYVSSCKSTTVDGKTDLLLYPDDKDESSAEWHKWFGSGNYSSSTMINTTADGATVSGMTSTLFLQGNYTLTQYGHVENNTIQGFCITVNGQNLESTDPSSLSKEERYALTPAEKGSAPQMFVILDQGSQSDNTKGWQWPIERHDIMDAYDNFKSWAANHEDIQNQNWHKKPNSTEVVAERTSTHKYTFTGDIPGGGGGGNTPVDPTPSKVSYEDLSITKVWDRACNAVYSLTFSTSDWDACSGIKVNNPGEYDLYKDSNFYNKIKTIYSNTTKFGKEDESATYGVTIGNSMPSAVDGYYTVYLVDWGGTFSSVDLYTE